MMKKYLIASLLLLTFFSGYGMAQNNQTMNAIVFSENGERFWLVINGIRQNDQATQNVKVTELRGLSWQFKIVFENENIKEFNKTIYAVEGPSREVTFAIGKNKKGDYRLKYYGEVPLDTSAPNQNQETITYHEEELPTQNPAFDLRIGRDGVRVTVNPRERQNPNPNERRNTTQQPTSRNSTPCNVAMSNQELAQATQSITNKSFEEDRMIVAKQILRTRCVNAAQVLEIAKIFDFEASRLDFAKFAYDYTTDPQNYYLVNDAFDFSESIRMLDEYIQNRN